MKCKKDFSYPHKFNAYKIIYDGVFLKIDVII